MADKTTKLHEILAVEGDLGATAKRILDEGIVTFDKRDAHFMGIVKSVRMFDEEREGENTDEEKALTTTVGDKLDYVSKAFAKYMDASLQKDATNQEASADLIVDGTVIAENVPATFLLGLENHLKRLRPLYENIPTLQPGINWKLDPDRGKGIYVAPPETNFRTEKVRKHEIIVQPTEHHPAQVDTMNVDVNVARVTNIRTSGMLTPVDKSTLLGRLDSLIQATKRARQRANGTEVINRNIGKALVGFIHADIV